MKNTMKKLLSLLLVAVMMTGIGILPSATIPAQATTVSIPSDAVEFNGHYYKVYDESLSWSDAKAFCESLGGHLAVITSSEEQEVITEYTKANGVLLYYYIGGYKENGGWNWITGETFEYSCWSPGEPRLSGSVIQIYNNRLYEDRFFGAWDDTGSSNTGKDIGFICEWDSDDLILQIDTDADAIPDFWEKYGIDADNDGVIDLDLPAMGADPNVPDIFVEVDWMVRPEKKFLWWVTKSSHSFKPTESQMRMVYDAFKAKKINLHIDVGPDSTDFVTGKKWGELSGGNEVAYVASLAADNGPAIWYSLLDMEECREMVFHHCIFAERLFSDPKDSTSGAAAIGTQCFTITLGNWAAVNDKVIAGSFMHELGHTLGLMHGGCDEENYKPNYLSVMNYAFQTTGLEGTGALDYSSYLLPDIDEKNINEKTGIDPNGETEGTGLKTILFASQTNNARKTVKISKAEIDFNGNGIIDENSYSLNLNPDGNEVDLPIAVLKGNYIDWEHLNYASGEIGSLLAEGISAELILSDAEIHVEKTLEEALRTETLAVDGTGYVEMIATTLIKDFDNQNLYFDVVNMGSEDATYAITISCDELFSEYKADISVPGSKTKIEKTRVTIPVNADVDVGSYEISCVLSYPEKEDVSSSFTVAVYEPTEEELAMLSDYIAESDELLDLDKDVLSEMKKIVEQYEEFNNPEVPTDPEVPTEPDVPTDPETPDDPSDDATDCSCLCHSKNSFMQFIYTILRFLWQLFGMNMDCACGAKHFDAYFFG